MLRKVTLAVLITVCLTGEASAQWRLLKSFTPLDGWNNGSRSWSAYVSQGIVIPEINSAVRAVHFLTREGQPDTGFVSVATYDSSLTHVLEQIWRTSDAGQTWLKVFDDSEYFGHYYSLYNFTFENAKVGYCGTLARAGQDWTLKTMDGGLSWSAILVPNSNYGWSKLYYHIPKNRLFLTWNGIEMSSDHGITWSQRPADGYEYGMSFANDTLGYASGWTIDDVTTNGGLTWQALPIASQGWQPLALAPRTFFSISQSKQIAQRSFDAGKTWQTMPLPYIDQPTGDIEGTYKRLYVIGRKGVATSTDSGSTWRHICGPTNDYAADHAVRGDTMYTGDYLYGLWMNPTGQDSDIRYPLLGGGIYSGTVCTDTVAWFGLYNGNSCSQLNVQSFAFWGSNRFWLLSDTSKHHSAMGISDTLSFGYNPYGVGSDTLFVQVKYTVGTDVHIDTFDLFGYRARPFVYSWISRTSSTLLGTSCDSSVSYITITNRCCDTLALQNLRLAQSINFHLDSASKTRLLPGDSVVLRVVGRAIVDGTYRDTLRYRLARSIDLRDSTVPIYFQQTNPVSIHIDRLALQSARLCAPLDTVIQIRNTFCDSLTVTGIDLQDTAIFRITGPAFPVSLAVGSMLPVHLRVRADSLGTFVKRATVHLAVGTLRVDTVLTFSIKVAAKNPMEAVVPTAATFQDSCALKNLRVQLTNHACDAMEIDAISETGDGSLDTTFTYPVQLPADSSISFPISPTAYARGTYTTTVEVQLRALGISYDTALGISYSVLSNVRPRITTRTARITMPTSTLCGSFDTTLYFTNTSCRTIEWVATDWTIPLADYSIANAPALPRYIASGTKDSIQIHYVPGAPGPRNAQLHLAFVLDASRLDTTIVYSGTVVPGGLIAPATVELDSVSKCTWTEREAWLVNVACDSIEIVQITSSDPLVTIVSPKPGTWVHTKDSVAIHIRFTPGATGEFLATITATDSSNNGRAALPFSVHAFVVAPAPQLRIAPPALVLVGIPPCMTVDTSVTIVNQSQCDSLTLQSASLLQSGPQLQLDASALPRTLAPGDSIRLVFHWLLAPLSTASDTCRIVGDTSFALFLSATSGNAQSVLGLPTALHQLRARICSTDSKYIDFANDGCAAIEVDSIRLNAPSSHSSFALTRIPSCPRTLQPGEHDSIEITFDAESADTLVALVYIASTATNARDSIRITGMGYGNPASMRLGGRVNNAAFATALPGQTISYSLRFRDSLASGAGLRSVSARLNFNDNLLTPQQISPANGWRLSSQAPHSGGIDLTLTKSDPNGPIAVDDPLVNCDMTVAATKDSQTTIIASPIQFNAGDSNYARCVLAAVSTSDTATFTIGPFCGDQLIRHEIAGTSLIELLRIAVREPSATRPIAQFTLAGDADIMLEVYDELGRVVFTTGGISEVKGYHEVPLSLPSEGSFVLLLKAGQERRVEKFVYLR